MKTQDKRLTSILLTVALILGIPLVAMQFTAEVVWTLADFILMGGLLLGTGLLAELIIRKVKKKDYQIGIIAILLIALFIIWAELSVGIFGTPFAGS